MNLSRGLLRLWLVFAVLWMIGGAWLFRFDLAQNCSDFEAATTKKELREMTVHELNCLLSLKEAKASPYYAIWLPQRDAVLWMVIPPVALLILGLAAGWTIQGFKKPHSN